MKLVDFLKEIKRTDFKFRCDESLPKYKRINDTEEYYVRVKATSAGVPLPDEFEDMPLKMAKADYQKERERASKVLLKSSLNDYLRNEDASKFNLLISNTLISTAKESKWWSNADTLLISPGEVKYMDGSTEGKEEKKTLLGRIKKLVHIGSKSVDELPEASKNVPERANETSIDVSTLFNVIKVETGKEREFVEKLDAYLSLLRKAHNLGQTAQEEKLVVMLINHVYESTISVSGFNHYVTVEELEKLQEQCERTLDIDYISNFGRVIPDEVAEKKYKADDLGVFDNYMILHYNPTGEQWKTEEERRREEEKKRDPILFGIIQGSNKLYMIADWVDLYCDLTWDEIVNKVHTGDLQNDGMESIFEN